MRTLLLAGICLAMCMNANAQKKRWTLEECISYAYEHNISIKQQELSTEEKRIALSESKWNYAPDISVSNSYSLSTGRVLDPTTYEFIENRTVAGNNTSVGASVPLFGGLRNHRELQRAKLDLRSALLAVEKLRNDVRLNVTAYYLEVLCAEEQIRTAEQTVAVLQVQEEKTAVKVDAHKVTMADLLQIRSQLAEAENEVLTARNSYDIARLNLCQFLEIADYATFQTVAPDDAEPVCGGMAEDPLAVIDAAQTLPELEAARVGIAIAQRDLQIARAAYYPTVSLSVGYGSSYSDARTKMFQNPDGTYRYDAYPFFEQYRDNASSYVSLSVSIPIFGKLTARKNVQRRKLAVQRAEYELYTIEKQVEKEVVQATIDARTAWQRYLGAQKFVQSADEALRQVTRKYELGVVSATDYNTAVTTAVKARSQLLQTKYEYLFKVKIIHYYLDVDFYSRRNF
ncbi:MAG: TolC family protein [Bacteroides cellulosilyticus]|nr:TolC family protein [Bacteroides cellulosilyticus]